ncbi:MAG: cyclodeaminase/cyclohydrolase family protein [Actinomycetota bacterium]|nr:cyclodeaminase/cyclohydrolase family protein [Actinomycetota bacterium]
MTRPYADHSVAELLDLVAAREPAPGGGAVAALSMSFAAGLVAMAARFSDSSLADADELVAEMDRLRRRAAHLADVDADAYRAVIAATGDKRHRALRRAAEVPLEVSAVGASITSAGALVVADGSPRVRGDAITGVLLAEAGVRSAARLVEINVRGGAGEEELVRRAARHVEVAGRARRSVDVSSR